MHLIFTSAQISERPKGQFERNGFSGPRRAEAAEYSSQPIRSSQRRPDHRETRSAEYLLPVGPLFAAIMGNRSPNPSHCQPVGTTAAHRDPMSKGCHAAASARTKDSGGRCWTANDWRSSATAPTKWPPGSSTSRASEQAAAKMSAGRSRFASSTQTSLLPSATTGTACGTGCSPPSGT